MKKKIKILNVRERKFWRNKIFLFFLFFFFGVNIIIIIIMVNF